MLAGVKPENGKAWKLLHMAIPHTNGTLTLICVYQGSEVYQTVFRTESASATATYYSNNAQDEVYIDDTKMIQAVSGDLPVASIIVVLEWHNKPAEETAKKVIFDQPISITEVGRKAW